MLKPADFEIDDRQARKIRTFYGLLAEGKEFYYTPFPDTLYADLNMTLTDKHLALCMLRYLEKEIAERAEEIMKTDRSKRSKVLSIAKLVKGKTLTELYDASMYAIREINPPAYITEEIKRLKPTKLVVWTDTPIQTVNPYVRMKIDPLYNCDEEIIPIIIYATELQHDNGVLNGEVNFLPDEYFRHNIQHLEYLNFLKKVAERIV